MTSVDSSTGAGAASGRIGARPTVRRRRLDRVLAIAGVLGDLAALNLAMILAYWLRFRSGWLPVTKGEPLTRDAYLGAMVAVSVVWLAIFAGLDMYRPQRWTRVLDESYRVLIGAVGVLVAVMAMSFFYRSFEYSRLTAGIAFVIAVLLVVGQRAVGLNLAASVRRRPAFRRRVAVLAPEGAELIDGQEREQAYATDRPADDYDQALALVRDDAVDEVVSHCGVAVGVVITDSHGRPFRLGTVGVAIGVAGIPALWDRRGEQDLYGYTLEHTDVGVADEIAAAAGLLLGQASEGQPVVLLRGLQFHASPGKAADLIRPKELDLYR